MKKMKTIQSITATENVSLITLHNSPADLKFVAAVFEAVAKSGVIVDMIAQAAPIGAHTSLSFTVSDDEVGKALELIKTFRELSPDIKPVVSNGNCKISVYGEAMRTAYGVASTVFSAAASVSADIRLVTTSEVDISILVTESDRQAAFDAICSAFAD